MIISHILGGLGNQMFQYATGKALALSKAVPFLLDLHDFDRYRLHQGFELDRIFAVEFKRAELGEVQQLLGWRAQDWVIKVLKRHFFKPFRGPHFVMEPYWSYWPSLRQVADEAYLYGYWQSEKYFLDFESSIRSDFSFVGELDRVNATLKEKILKTGGISLHVRRGDYVSDKKTAAVMAPCGEDFYAKAMTYMAERLTQPTFYVFSDDMAWTKAHLPTNFDCIYVDHNQGKQSYIDLQLMGYCQHHIIANSSFSWWGAWLNPNPRKIVLAPTLWHINPVHDQDRIPQGWVKL